MKGCTGILATILVVSGLYPQVHCLQADLTNYLRTGETNPLKQFRWFGDHARDDVPDVSLDAEEGDLQSKAQDAPQNNADVDLVHPEPSDNAVEHYQAVAVAAENELQRQDGGDAVHEKMPEREDRLPSDHLTAWGSIWEPPADADKPHVILGIGFPKCGSHYTWEVLSRAEGTVTGYSKELMYFEWPAGSSETPCKPLNLSGQDLNLNPAQQYVKACYGSAGEVPGAKLLEFSPGYAGLRDGKLDATMERLKGVEPFVNLRMVALVRDPVQRATSEINMFRDYGTVNGTDEELSQTLHKQMTEFDPVGYHIGAGEYADRLKVWMRNFPKEKLLIVNTAQLDDKTTWKRMFQHVGLGLPTDGWLQGVLNKVHDNGRKSKSTYMKLADDVKDEMHAHYAGLNSQLWDLLEVKPWW